MPFKDWFSHSAIGTLGYSFGLADMHYRPLALDCNRLLLVMALLHTRGCLTRLSSPYNVVVEGVGSSKDLDFSSNDNTIFLVKYELTQ